MAKGSVSEKQLLGEELQEEFGERSVVEIPSLMPGGVRDKAS